MASFQQEKLQNDILEVHNSETQPRKKTIKRQQLTSIGEKMTTKHNNDCLNTEKEKNAIM